MNNPIHQELFLKGNYFDVLSYVTKDSKITLHNLPKEAATKKLRLRFSAHALGEYLYIVAKNGLTLRHRTYAINQTDKDLSE